MAGRKRKLHRPLTEEEKARVGTLATEYITYAERLARSYSQIADRDEALSEAYLALCTSLSIYVKRNLQIKDLASFVSRAILNALTNYADKECRQRKHKRSLEAFIEQHNDDNESICGLMLYEEIGFEDVVFWESLTEFTNSLPLCERTFIEERVADIRTSTYRTLAEVAFAVGRRIGHEDGCTEAYMYKMCKSIKKKFEAWWKAMQRE